MTADHNDYDLAVESDVNRMLSAAKPDIFIHLAAYVGGIGANQALPADFLFRNTLLTVHAFDAAAKHGIQKLIFPI